RARGRTRVLRPPRQNRSESPRRYAVRACAELARSVFVFASRLTLRPGRSVSAIQSALPPSVSFPAKRPAADDADLRLRRRSSKPVSPPETRQRNGSHQCSSDLRAVPTPKESRVENGSRRDGCGMVLVCRKGRVAAKDRLPGLAVCPFTTLVHARDMTSESAGSIARA